MSPASRLPRCRLAGVGVSTLLGAVAALTAASCGPPPAPEELPRRFVFRFEFKDPCDQPIPGVQFELDADPFVVRPERPAGAAPHEWRSHVRSQSDEFGEARVDLGTDWGSIADIHAAFAGKIDEVRAAPDCFLELGNRAILEVVLDTYNCAASQARTKKSSEPFVQLYTRSVGDTFRRRHRVQIECRDQLPPQAPAPAPKPGQGTTPGAKGKADPRPAQEGRR